jgi:protein-S-isoprenylcysteine O-methyltransferase Ste14
MTMQGSHDDAPGVIAPPPLLVLGGFGGGLLLDRLLPLRLGARGPRRAAGAACALGGLALGGWAFGTMRRQGTNVDPREPATTVVSDGPFRFTRNPIYTGMASTYLGLALLVNRPIALLRLAGLWRVFNHGIVDREERYLSAKFGDAYDSYRARVRRWL